AGSPKADVPRSRRLSGTNRRRRPLTGRTAGRAGVRTDGLVATPSLREDHGRRAFGATPTDHSGVDMTDTIETTTSGDIITELRDWLRDNWDPDLTVGQWWERLGNDGWS